MYYTKNHLYQTQIIKTILYLKYITLGNSTSITNAM
jgi:hypothetical protein